MPATSIVFDPEIDERQLDREVDSVNDAFSDAASDLSADFETDMSMGGGQRGGRSGQGLVALAYERNETLEEIRDSLQEDFVGASGGGGGGGGGGILGIFGLGGAGKAAGGLASALGLGGAGIAGAGAVGLGGLLRARQQLIRQGRVGEQAAPDSGTAASDASGRMDGRSVAEILQGWEWPDPPDLPTFSWPDVPDLPEFTWPETPDLPEFRWPDVPNLIDDIVSWEWPSFPDPPGWIGNLLDLFGGGRSRTTQRPDWAMGGGDQRLANAAQNQAATRNRTDVRVEPQINVDPQRLADDVAREAEQIFSDLVSDLERSLRDNANNSQIGTSPGRRFG